MEKMPLEGEGVDASCPEKFASFPKGNYCTTATGHFLLSQSATMEYNMPQRNELQSQGAKFTSLW